MVPRLSLSVKGKSSSSHNTSVPCGRTSLVQTPMTSAPSDGKEHEGSNLYGWAYFPFNDGPRACLGQDFAPMEVSYTVARLLQRFRTIRLLDGETDEPGGAERQRLTLVRSSADGCGVESEKRIGWGKVAEGLDRF